MAVLTLDLGWHFGWCTWRRGDNFASGHVNLAKESRLDGVRLLAFTQWLDGTLKLIRNAGEELTDVRFEQITFTGKDNGPEAMHAHGKQLGAVERWCALRRIKTCEGIPFNTVKLHVAGNGYATQGAVLAAVQRKFPKVLDHNEASAVAVMLTAIDRECE